MALKSITIKEGQTLYDIALQYYGDVSKALDVVKLNNDQIPDLVYNKLTGLTINVDEQDNDVVNYYKTNQINIVTRYPEITTGKAFSLSFSLAYM